MRIDSHQHFWNFTEPDFGWIQPNQYILRRDYLPQDLEPLVQSNHLDGCVAVQARQTIAETNWLLDLADEHPFIQGVIGWVPLQDTSGEPWLERYAGNPYLVGVRHVIHDEVDDGFILSESFNAGIRNLQKYQLVYDILIFSIHLPQTIAFVDMHPNQLFVVDHIAKPVIKNDTFDQDWADTIRKLAHREHVYCKLSGIVTEVRDSDWNEDTLRPYFDVALEAFGPERLMFGSDWPVCLLRSEYNNWVYTVKKLTEPLSLHEQNAIWGDTAQKVYAIHS